MNGWRRTMEYRTSTESVFRRVTGGLQDRGGLLGHGSLLTVTSYPTRTSPVLRGKWILDNILGTPPPPPAARRASPGGHRGRSAAHGA